MITLIMVALASVIVVALLTNATLDRGTSKSVGDRYQAETAVRNGLEAAKKALIASPDAAGSITADDSFLILRADGNQSSSNGTKDTYYFSARARTGAVDCYPLFSGGTQSPLTINLATAPYVQKPTAPTGAFTNPAQDTFGSTTKKYPTLYSFQQPVFTQWQEIRDPNDTATGTNHDLPYQRFTFWIEDAAGYLDAGVVGNTNNGGTKHQRVNGTNTNEIALFTIFDPNSQTDPGNASSKTLVDDRPILFTVPTLKQVAPPSGGGTDVTQANLAVRFGTDVGGEKILIPRGYGYSTEAQPATDLNAKIAAKDVTGIATAITTTLPQFVNRSGGLPSVTFNYAKNLSANIIDYADANNAPTTDGSTYRGVGAFPFLVSTFDKNNWVATGSAPPYPVTIQVSSYIQLWNPHNIAVTGALSVHYENVDSLTVNGTTKYYTPPADYVDPAFSMQPNTYKVIMLPKATGTYAPQSYSFDWGPTPPASNASIPFPGTSTVFLTLSWNGKLADRTYKNVSRPTATTGMKYNGSNPNSSSNWVWRGNAAPPIYPDVGTPGDARSSFYLNRIWTAANYTNSSSWGGRLWLKTTSIEMQPSIWPDGGHNSIKGYNPTNSVTPDVAAGNIVPTAADANMWVSFLSTKGSLDSLAELGRVFDPGQWNYTVPTSNGTTGLPDIPTSATSDNTAGGGYSLCVGRPEFTKFDVDGQRAWQLVDIFGLGTRKATTGLINVNTASFETLRALAAGILQANDAAIVPNSLVNNFYPPTAAAPTSSEDSTRTNGAQADLFAQAVVDSRPFLSIGQLQTASNSIGPFFGNPKQWQDQTLPTEWNDSGREELFSKLLNLTTVRSRNFRVFVTGQSLDKNGNVQSTVSKVFQLFLNPTRDATGAITSQRVEIKYEAAL